MVFNESVALIAPGEIGGLNIWVFDIFIPWVGYFLLHQLLPRMGEMLYMPLVQTEMLWVVVPLIGTVVLMTFYFGAHKSEDLGWNTAFGNSMVLIFTAINLLQRIYGNISINDLVFNEDTVIALLLAAEGVFLLFLNFFHFLPRKIAFFISSPLHVNALAAFGVIIVYSQSIALDGATILAVILLYLLSGILFFTLKHLVPGVREHLENMTERSYLAMEKKEMNPITQK